MSYLSKGLENYGYYSLESIPIEIIEDVRKTRKQSVVRNSKFHLLNLLGFYTKEQLKTDLFTNEAIEKAYCKKIGKRKYVSIRSIEAIKENGLVRTGLEAMIKNVYDDS